VFLMVPESEATNDWMEDNDVREELYVLSDLTVKIGTESSVTITRTPHQKCARCWRHRAAVGTIAAYPELCDRCAGVMEAGA
jgi:isoleucyl-tRNA synthetase